MTSFLASPLIDVLLGVVATAGLFVLFVLSRGGGAEARGGCGACHGDCGTCTLSEEDEP